MNVTRIATVVTAPAGDGWGTVTTADQTLSCYFDPVYFVAPDPVPIAGDRLFVTSGGNSLKALYVIGRGEPAGG